MRREDNFSRLLKDKKIVIPIIQRDYAQGRNNPKAMIVRTRLIDEWIDILQNHELRMDFNYIYGNGENDVFYPVDGQQRLTSLYLLHWYLAISTEHSSEISGWRFDYKTRNSASEFFAFLKDVKRSQGLFDILARDIAEAEKQSAVRNEKWFKTKWENDPTVVSCINFLCMLSGKLGAFQDNFNSFWERLNDEEKPAVYFTCLNECGDEYAEIDAAKKYTRMNARGKRLTNFENLKAMIDEIEMKHIDKLRYHSAGGADDCSNTISWAYDRTYLDVFYQCLDSSTLIEKTKMINDESEKWFRLIYYVYSLRYNKKIPRDIIDCGENSCGCYEDVIYKISQERIIDETIVEYLYMIKAVFELLCNSKTDLAYRYSSFSLDDVHKRRKAIAFVIFGSFLWDPQNTEEENGRLLIEWREFEEMLEDLAFDAWSAVDDREIASILLKMSEGIKQAKSVTEYFLCNDFKNNNPFGQNRILPDIKCRIIERKIKSKLLKDQLIDKNQIEITDIGTQRWGYLYYLCGYLEDWDIGDWSGRPLWTDKTICGYIDLLAANPSLTNNSDAYNARLVYAFASQYDTQKQCLQDEASINKCSNEHIWSNHYLEWTDEEFGSLKEKRKTQLDHLRTMLELLLGYRDKNNLRNEAVVQNYVKYIADFFENSAGYEKCWLRFAVKYAKGGRELLSSELEYSDGIVKLGNVPVILKCYIKELGYSFNEKIHNLKEFHQKFTYFAGDDNKIPFYHVDRTCTFAPDADNTGKYQHTVKTEFGWDLSGNTVSRNMDLSYRAYLNLSGTGCRVKNSFLSMKGAKGVYKLSIYELGAAGSGKVQVNINEAELDQSTIAQVEADIQKWKGLFDEIKAHPKEASNYDRWIELWNNDYITAFGDSFCLGAAVYEKSGGQRPRKIWSEIFDIPALSWSRRQELI